MAKPTVRMNLNISPEAAAKLEKLVEMKILGDKTSKTAVIEQAINRLYDEKN